MIQSFGNKTAEHIFHGKSSREARRLPVILIPRAQRQLDQINAAVHLIDLRIPPGNRLELLKGDLKNFHSIRINDQWRIIFVWAKDGVHDVKIIDYH